MSSTDFENLNIEPNGSLHTTYFALGSTIVKSFLEEIVEKKNIFKKIHLINQFIMS